jgi:hypothetical protein
MDINQVEDNSEFLENVLGIKLPVFQKEIIKNLSCLPKEKIRRWVLAGSPTRLINNKMDINTETLRLGRLREEQAHMKERLAVLQEEFNRDNDELIQTVKLTATTIDEVESSIRQDAVEQFKANGTKSFDCGVAIKMFTILNYEKDRALAWAKEHLIALSLDKTAFEKIVKADEKSKPDFVEIIEEPRATIPTKIQV